MLRAFDAGADYIEPDKAEVAGRGAKKGSVKSKAASKARKARLKAIGKRIAAAHEGRPGRYKAKPPLRKLQSHIYAFMLFTLHVCCGLSAPRAT